MKTKGGKSIFSKIVLISVVVLLINLGVVFYKYTSDSNSSLTGLSMKSITDAYQTLSFSSKIFLIIEWSLLTIFLLFIFIKNKPKKPEKPIQADELRRASLHSNTDLDTLYNLLKERKHLKILTIAKTFKINTDIVIEWANLLESGNLAILDQPTFGPAILKLKKSEGEIKEKETEAESKGEKEKEEEIEKEKINKKVKTIKPKTISLKEKQKSPIGWKVIAILYFLIGLALIFSGVVFLIKPEIILPTIEQVQILKLFSELSIMIKSIILMGFGIITLLVSPSLWKGKNWARVLAIVLALILAGGSMIPIIKQRSFDFSNIPIAFLNLTIMGLNIIILLYLLFSGGKEKLSKKIHAIKKVKPQVKKQKAKGKKKK